MFVQVRQQLSSSTKARKIKMKLTLAYAICFDYGV